MPHPTRATINVASAQAGERLDRVLAAGTELSRTRLKGLILDGAVAIGPRTIRDPGHRVNAGDIIAVEVPPPEEAKPEGQRIPLDIVYEDADIVVIDKAAGMVVHPAAGHADGTLVNALLHHVDDLSGVGGELRPGIVHRLDKGTSGLMVVAKHDAAHESLASQFEERHVEKEYTALVWGVLSPGRRIEEPIGRDPNNRQRMSTKARRARTAVSRITWSEPFPGVCLVGVGIATGRTHQIRVHLSSIGHPVVGDALYGGVHRRVPPQLRAVQTLDRPFLHASRLSFAHPGDGRRLEFRSELPANLADVVERLRHDAEHLAY